MRFQGGACAWLYLFVFRGDVAIQEEHFATATGELKGSIATDLVLEKRGCHNTEKGFLRDREAISFAMFRDR